MTATLELSGLFQMLVLHRDHQLLAAEKHVVAAKSKG